MEQPTTSTSVPSTPTYVLSFDVGIKNLAYCFMNLDTNEIIQWGIQDISVSHLPKSKQTFDAICNELIAFLDMFLATHMTHDIGKFVVLLENQPAFKTPKMKSIQVVLYSYFKIMDAHAIRESDVIMVSATSKNKYMISKGFDVIQKNYKSNKQNSIKYITEFLSGFDETHTNHQHMRMLERSKKKDDLCDALLQILSYFRK